MPVYPNDSLAYDGEPALLFGPDSDVWEFAWPLAAGMSGWPNSDVSLTTAWFTKVSQGRDLAPTRDGLRSRPSRIATYRLFAAGRNETGMFRGEQSRASRARHLLPLICDETYLTVLAAAAATTLTCDASDRRFFQGGRVLILKPEVFPAIGPTGCYEIAAVASATDTSITLAAGLSQEYPSGSRVMPLIECDPAPEQGADLASDRYATHRFDSAEAAGRSQLPAWMDAAATPPGAASATLDGITAPIWDVALDWPNVSVGFAGVHWTGISGLSQMTQVRGDRSPVTAEAQFVSVGGRAEAVRLLRWFDSRRGRLHPFWLPLPCVELNSDSVTAGGIIVIGDDPRKHLYPLGHIRYLSAQLNDGSVRVHKITGAALAGGGVEISLTPAPDYTTADLIDVGAAILATFDADELSESWRSPEVMSCGLKFREALDYLADAIDVPPRPDPPDFPPPFPPPGDPPGDPPDPDPCNPDEDCNGNPMNVGIRAGSGHSLIYDPDTGRVFTIQLGQEVDCESIVELDGWQPVTGDEAWLPDCPPTGPLCCCCIDGVSTPNMSEADCLLAGGTCCDSFSGLCCDPDHPQLCCGCEPGGGGPP